MTKWAELRRLHEVNSGRHILDLFDENRAEDFSIQADGMLFDYSKTNIDAATRAALVKLAEVSGVAEKRAAMFSGAKINDTEGRAVLHVALRAARRRRRPRSPHRRLPAAPHAAPPGPRYR